MYDSFRLTRNDAVGKRNHVTKHRWVVQLHNKRRTFIRWGVLDLRRLRRAFALNYAIGREGNYATQNPQPSNSGLASVFRR
jgi:hypothetical protein